MEPFALEINLVTVDQATDGSTADAGTRRLQVRGDVDMSSAGQLAASIDEQIDGGATTVVIDATGITFLDSTGLRVLVDAATRLESTSGTLLIDPMSSSVRRVLEMTGLLTRYGAA